MLLQLQYTHSSADKNDAMADCSGENRNLCASLCLLTALVRLQSLTTEVDFQTHKCAGAADPSHVCEGKVACQTGID